LYFLKYDLAGGNSLLWLFYWAIFIGIHLLVNSVQVVFKSFALRKKNNE